MLNAEFEEDLKYNLYSKPFDHAKMAKKYFQFNLIHVTQVTNDVSYYITVISH